MVNLRSLVASGVSLVAVTSVLAGSSYANAETVNGGCSPNAWDMPVNSVEDPQVFREFDKDLGKYDAGHRGVDLLVDLGGAEAETAGVVEIVAPEDGVLTWKGIVADTPTITFTVGNLKNTYQRASTPLSAGTEVKKGEKIGVVEPQPRKKNTEGEGADKTGADGKTVIDGHCGDQDCLHWGVINNETDTYLDPLDQVFRKRIVLK